MSKYLEKIDRIIMRDVSKLKDESISLLCVLIMVPTHIIWLCFRIMFPWLIPFTTKEDT